MRTAIVFCIFAAVAAGAAERPVFDDKGELRFPENYREWIYLSSGLGMTYGPNAAQVMESPFFDNVYVNPPVGMFTCVRPYPAVPSGSPPISPNG